jgi:hypothetical protein
MWDVPLYIFFCEFLFRLVELSKEEEEEDETGRKAKTEEMRGRTTIVSGAYDGR